MKTFQQIDNQLALALIEQQLAVPCFDFMPLRCDGQTWNRRELADSFMVNNMELSLFTSDDELNELAHKLLINMPHLSFESLYQALNNIRHSLLPLRFNDSFSASIEQATMYDTQNRIFEENEYEIGISFSQLVEHLVNHSFQSIQVSKNRIPTANLKIKIQDEEIRYNAQPASWLDFIVNLESLVRKSSYLTIAQRMQAYLKLDSIDLDNNVHKKTLLRSYSVFMGEGCLSSIYPVFDACDLAINNNNSQSERHEFMIM